MQAPSPADADPTATSRADLMGGAGWTALGIAVLVGALRMDRLQDQGVAPYAAPGLLPGLLAIAMLLFGALLALRGWRGGGARPAPSRAASLPGRLVLVLGLCLAFGLGLVGHGLPFWAASALFVATAILVLRPAGNGPRFGARAACVAAAIGLGAGLGVTLVFQGLFLVHLP